MFVDREDMIRSHAYGIWLNEGQPHGRALDHWLAAQRELLRPDVVLPWFEATSHGDETSWMRRALWTAQPFEMTR